VPVGPTLDFTSPHGREQRRAAPPAEPSAKEIEATRL